MIDSPTPLARIADRLVGMRASLFVALLVLLHVVILLGPTSGLGRTLFVAHLGLFIVWQPFVRSDLHLSAVALVAFALAVVGILFWLNGWLLVFWITVLGGIVGGKVLLFDARGTKYFYLLALGYLVTALLFLALPEAVPAQINPRNAATTLGQALSPVVFLAMLLIPGKQEPATQPEVIDFIYSLLMVLLLGVLVLGSLALMLLLHNAYVEALAETLVVIGVVLLILGWAWAPHGGMAGIGTVFSRYLLSIGLPMEQWLHTVTDLAHGQRDPEKFVAAACEEMVRRLSWVTGVSWTTPATVGCAGSLVGRSSEFRFGSLELAIYTPYSMDPALVWHFNLLAQLIAEFHSDKQRSRQLEHLTYLQAVHETGARLTHDTKNLLQVLKTLCTAAEAADGSSPEFAALLRRQLPAITTRLQQTLDKLREPQPAAGQEVAAAAWWHQLCHRYASAPVRFTTDGLLAGDRGVPAALFDHVVENLLANALAKTADGGAVPVDVVLRDGAGGCELEVSDGGQAIPGAIAAELMRGPIPSEHGLGIGLYQSARMAAQSDYELTLVSNVARRVSFRLAPKSP